MAGLFSVPQGYRVPDMRKVTMPDRWEAYFPWFQGLVGTGLLLGGGYCVFLAVVILSGGFTGPVEQAPVEVTGTTGGAAHLQSLARTSAVFSLGMGSMMLAMALAVLVLGMILMSMNGTRRGLATAGYLALLMQTILLATVFHWPVFIVFLLTAAALFVGTEWEEDEDTQGDTVSLVQYEDKPDVEEEDDIQVKLVEAGDEDEQDKGKGDILDSREWFSDESRSQDAADVDKKTPDVTRVEESDTSLEGTGTATTGEKSADGETEADTGSISSIADKKPGPFRRFLEWRRRRRDQRSRRSRPGKRHDTLKPAGDRDQVAAELKKLRKELSQLKRKPIPVTVKPYKPEKPKLMKLLDLMLGFIIIGACFMVVIAVLS